jgi:hypothetical protein
MDASIAALLVLVAGALLVVTYRAVGGGARRAFATPLATIGEATAPGIARFAGTAVALGQAPVSEASGRPYVARDLRIVPGGGGDSASTRPAQQAVDFLLDDGTGVALVRAAEAGVTVDRDHEMPATTLDQVPWVDAILRSGGYRNGSPATCTIRLYEGVLGPGDRAGVVGHVEPADAEARAAGASVVVRPEGTTRVAIRKEPAPAGP